MSRLRSSYLVAFALALCPIGCKRAGGVAPSTSTSAPVPSGSLGPPEAPPQPRQGMVWIRSGALVAGTPPDAFPRIADEEMPGQQVILKGFYIDIFPFPNEEGAIPLTGVSQNEAAALCEEKQKRLCTELEWERACKGPSNLVYEYGNTHKPDRCGTGSMVSLRPCGFLVGCRSDFGVRDMHGGVWEWTQSSWGRGSDRPLASLRGGNAPQGELVGRCANGMARPPETKAANSGFRCCAGPKNDAEVVLNVVRGNKLDLKNDVGKELASQVMALLDEDAKRDIGELRSFRFDRHWIWRPIGNEELHVLGGCSGLAVKPACGIAVARVTLTQPKLVAWVSSGHWTPMIHTDMDARDLWLFGGDELGQFRRVVGYVWGSVSVGEKERRVPKPPKDEKKKKKK